MSKYPFYLRSSFQYFRQILLKVFFLCSCWSQNVYTSSKQRKCVDRYNNSWYTLELFDFMDLAEDKGTIWGNWKNWALDSLWIRVHDGMFPNTKLKGMLLKKLERLLRAQLPHKAIKKNQPHSKALSPSQWPAKSNSTRQPAGVHCSA